MSYTHFHVFLQNSPFCVFTSRFFILLFGSSYSENGKEPSHEGKKRHQRTPRFLPTQ